MAGKRRAVVPEGLRVTDNVPAGMAVSLAGLPPALSFASVFRDELMARGVVPAPVAGGRRGRKKLG